MVSSSYTDMLQRGIHVDGTHDNHLPKKTQGSREVPVDVLNISRCDRQVLVSWILRTLQNTTWRSDTPKQV
jgi:hypothetical protein